MGEVVLLIDSIARIENKGDINTSYLFTQNILGN